MHPYKYWAAYDSIEDHILSDKKNITIEVKEGYIYDPVAQKHRKATDEEYVRQEMVKTMVNEYRYPLTAMETEFRVKIGSKRGG